MPGIPFFEFQGEKFIKIPVWKRKILLVLLLKEILRESL